MTVGCRTLCLLLTLVEKNAREPVDAYGDADKVYLWILCGQAQRDTPAAVRERQQTAPDIHVTDSPPSPRTKERDVRVPVDNYVDSNTADPVPEFKAHTGKDLDDSVHHCQRRQRSRRCQSKLTAARLVVWRLGT